MTFYPSSSSCTSLNITLPHEMMIKIFSYLSMHDIINLLIAKLIDWNRLICIPGLTDQLNHFLIHALCQYFMMRNNIFNFCSVIPIIIDANFYFAIDTSRLSFLHTISCRPYSITWSPLFIFSFIYKSFAKYSQLSYKKEFQIMLRNIPDCHLLCECFHYCYKNVNIKTKIYKRDCCMSPFICLLEQ
jgi:hypothetical protein